LDILVLKLDHRGDYLLAEISFRTLRMAFPNANITLICGTWNADAAKASGLFNDVIPFNFFPEDQSSVEYSRRESLFVEFEALIRGRRFDVAVDLRIESDTRHLVRYIECTYKAGFDAANDFPWLDIRLGLRSPTTEGRITQSFIDLTKFESRIGYRERYTIFFREDADFVPNTCLIWGPYIDFVEGEYEFEFHIAAHGKERLVNYDICTDYGNKIVAAGTLTAGHYLYPKIQLNFVTPAAGVEFRFHSGKDRVGDWSFSGIGWRRSGLHIGIHQKEMMYLLAQLVIMRLQFPYSHEVYTQ